MKKIVLFLHGYGSNGNDLISLKNYISLDKDTTEFISPNAPEPCEFNYFGYQWFPLKERSIEELNIGLKSAFIHLDSIIEKIIFEHAVDASQISLIGFSQGSMLAMYYALQKYQNFHSIISLSGSLPKEILNDLKIPNIKSSFLIFHGKLDDVVPYNRAVETNSFLELKKISCKLVLDDNCAHSISPIALDEINKFYKDWI
tara:strand:- start:5536 stop:6138 length:603 start_codon:yes stop_codon:yes gene_type:complete